MFETQKQDKGKPRPTASDREFAWTHYSMFYEGRGALHLLRQNAHFERLRILCVSIMLTAGFVFFAHDSRVYPYARIITLATIAISLFAERHLAKRHRRVRVEKRALDLVYRQENPTNADVIGLSQ